MKHFDYRLGQIIVFLPFILFLAEKNSEPVMLLTGHVTGQNVYKNVDASRKFSGFQHLHRSTHGASRKFSGYNSETL